MKLIFLLYLSVMSLLLILTGNKNNHELSGEDPIDSGDFSRAISKSDSSESETKKTQIDSAWFYTLNFHK